jgi:DNA repair protein RecN (Recombination protein N)
VIEELHVKDLALIEEVWLEFAAGMTVMSGETGAGKTALVGALKLLVGERADAGAVRAGQAEAVVEGRFAEASGEEIVARRRVGSDGRSRCTLDGQMATVGALSERLGPLVDLHGQHEHQALLSASTHVVYLDRWAGAEAATELAAYRSARTEHVAALRALAELEERQARASQNADYYRFVADEIDRVDPAPGEDATLEARLPALQHGEQLAAAADGAVEALRGDGGALDAVATAASSLARAEGIDPALDALVGQLSEASALVDDASAELRAYRDRVEHDSAALDEVLERLGQLSGLKRKYGPDLDSVIAARAEAASALSVREQGAEESEKARATVEAARSAMVTAAERLDCVRRRAAPEFVDALGAAVSDLAMSGSRFEVSFGDLAFDSWTLDGSYRIEFLYAPAPGQPARSLSRIASGGELSRVMLALKGVLGEADTVRTLVFDEVDAGIGGATAHTVGRRLQALSQTHQVIVVTHLAQVAAYADRQLVVEKSVTHDVATTTVRGVEGVEREAEIARMLSGNDSSASIIHARELLAEATITR